MIKKKYRILHASINTAGQPTVISRAQRLLGYKSDVLVFSRNYFNYECDINLDLKNQKSKLSKSIILLKNFISCVAHYDIFHFHSGLSLLPGNLDLPILKFFGKKVVMEYWGSDIIQTDIAVYYTCWTKENLAKIYPNINNDKKRKKIDKISRLANATIVGDYSLSLYSKKSKVIRQAIDLDNFPFLGNTTAGQKVTIIHAPTDSNIKGTKFVLEAIKRLKKENFSIEFMLVEKISHREAIEIYKKADIIVDSLLHGPYGLLAIECMALGKPVIGRVDPKLIHYYHNLPIVITTPDTIYKHLVKLIKNPKLRQKLGIQGRKYVEENHDSKIIARKLIKLYQKI